MNNVLKVFGSARLRTDTDGFGVTTLVCSMGCPLRCAYCLNPCSWDGTNIFKTYTVDELYEFVKRDNLYFLSTNGGIVFGGGEPLLSIEFIDEFISKYRSTGWKFSVETSLSTEIKDFERLDSLFDLFIVDSKDMNKERYELYTKGSFDLFENNLIKLLEVCGPDKIHVRVPVIPFLHKDEEYKENVLRLKELGFTRIEAFNYHNPSKKKKISENAKANMNAFLDNMIN